jgi:hypothetical protein
MFDPTYPEASQHLSLTFTLCSLIRAVQSELVFMSES